MTRFIILIIFSMQNFSFAQYPVSEEKLREAILDIHEEALALASTELPKYKQIVEKPNQYTQQEIKDLGFKLQDLNQKIGQLVSFVELGKSVLEVTDRRLSVIKYWGEILQPYNQILASESLKGNHGILFNNLAKTLLHHSLPNEELATYLKKELKKETDLTKSQTAMELLQQHRLLTDGDKAELLNKNINLTKKETEHWLSLVSEFNLIDKLPDTFVAQQLSYLEEKLSKPMPTHINKDNIEDDYYSNFSKLVSLAFKLGEKAKYLIPLIKSREKEIQTIMPNYKEPQYIYDKIQGLLPLRRIIARNGSGYLDTIINWDEIEAFSYADLAQGKINLLTDDSNQKAQSNQPTKQTTEEAKETTPQQKITTDPTQENPTNWIIYVLAIIVLLVILILLIAKNKKAKAS